MAGRTRHDSSAYGTPHWPLDLLSSATARSVHSSMPRPRRSAGSYSPSRAAAKRRPLCAT